MIRRFFGFNLDFAGAATATLCALHCSFVPILFSLGIMSNSHHNHFFDWTMMTIGLTIAGYILTKDYNSKHGKLLPITIAGIGFIILGIGIETHGELFFLNVLGGILIVISHFLNWRFSHPKQLNTN